MSSDRRRGSRYALSLPVAIGDVRGYTRNIGVHGALIVSPRAFEPGDVVELGITITFTEHAAPTALVCTATVRRVRKLHEQWVIAVEFEELRVLTDAKTPDRPRAATPASL